MKSKYPEDATRKIARLEQKIQSLEKARDQIKASAKGKAHGKVSRIYSLRIFGWKITIVRNRRSEIYRETGRLTALSSQKQSGQTAQSSQTAQSGQTTNSNS